MDSRQDDELPFSYGHREALRVLAAILRYGGRADVQFLTHTTQLPEGTVNSACGVLAANGLLSVSQDNVRMVYATTGAQMTAFLDKLSESYVWRTSCVPQGDQHYRDTSFKHG